jgi:catechol 2,3-dioxygenase-like lactoylglutathione lyase family enzyme
MIAGLDHVGFTVSNLGRALHFYRDLLGLEVLWERVFEEEYVRMLVGYPTATLQCAYLKLPASNTALELVEYQGVEGTRVDMHTANPGNAHLCLAVKDLDAVFTRLKAAGVEFVSVPATSTAGYYKGSKTVYLHDPDGISLQLVEPHLQGQ